MRYRERRTLPKVGDYIYCIRCEKGVWVGITNPNEYYAECEDCAYHKNFANRETTMRTFVQRHCDNTGHTVFVRDKINTDNAPEIFMRQATLLDGLT